MAGPAQDLTQPSEGIYSGTMEERDLVAILTEMERDSSAFYASELAMVQTDAIKRYQGSPYGDEKPGRAQVLENDLQHTVDWMMPHILRPFLSTDHICIVESETPNSDIQEKQIQGYLEHVFWKDNDGDTFLHDYVWDALVTKVGIASVTWEDPEPEPPKKVEGLLPIQLQKYLDDTEYEIIAQDSYIDEIEGQPVELFDLEYIRTPKYGKCCVEVVPPEEFSISRRAKNVDTAEYHRRKQRKYASDLMKMYPDRADEIDPKNYGLRDTGDEIEDLDRDPRRQERFENEAYDVYSENRRHERMYRLDVFTEYLWIDYDGDGITELRRIVRVGQSILENEIVDRSEFVCWSPVRVSHKWAGQSIDDQLKHISYTRTQIARKMLDSLTLALQPRMVGNASLLGVEGMDELKQGRIGGVITANGNAQEAVQQLVMPDVTDSAYQALEYYNQRLEVATGMTRHAQGVQPEAITDTAKGIQDLTSAANQRIELMARWLAKALEDVFRLMFDVISHHQDHGRVIKIKGQPMMIDPRLWNDECAISIDVGDSVDNREQKMQKLELMRRSQAEILLNAGMGNPWVKPHHYAYTLHQMAREAGYNQTDKFFAEVPEDYEPPPQPSEEEVKAQAKVKEAEIDAQVQAQNNQQKTQLEAQKAQQDMDLAVAKADHEAELAQMKAAAEAELAREKAAFEMQMQNDRQEFEREMAIKKFELEARVAAAQNARADDQQEQDNRRAEKKVNTEIKVKKNRPGGALHK